MKVLWQRAFDATKSWQSKTLILTSYVHLSFISSQVFSELCLKGKIQTFSILLYSGYLGSGTNGDPQ